jgi:twitching motility protein PilT
VLRQDPDVVLVGEMRDLETIEAALVISRDGSLVHGDAAHQLLRCRRSTACSTCSRRTSSRRSARSSFTLEGCISAAAHPQGLRGRDACWPGGDGADPAIRNLIREDKIHQIYSQMQVGQAKFGMQTMNQALRQLLASPQMQPGGQPRRPQ